MPWLRLIRWNNLVIIFLTQLLAWWCVILPEKPTVLQPLSFICLSLSTILIAAAGYIINDYFDIKIDAINKPDKVVLEKVIPRKQAIIAHALLNLAALMLAGLVAAAAHHLEWLLLQFTCILLLWFYSTDFKRQYITGNVVIALLTALTIISLIIYEPDLHSHRETNLLFKGSIFSRPEWVLLIYSFFAFLLTWMREIVKDMEDIKGDVAEGCITMPVKRGLAYAARFTLILSIIGMVILSSAAIILFIHYEICLPSYIGILLILPIAVWSIAFMRNSTTRHYHTASHWLKIIMMLGVCSLIIYHIQLLLNNAT